MADLLCVLAALLALHLSIVSCIKPAINEPKLAVSKTTVGGDHFCEAKLYEDHWILFISQYKTHKYHIFGEDGSFYTSDFDVAKGTFASPPVGPFNVTTSFAGSQSLAAYLASTKTDDPNRFAFLLFLEPDTGPAIFLQFLGTRIWMNLDGTHSELKWPSSCPTPIHSIINRAVQPHIVFDSKFYFYQLTVDITKGEIICSERSPMKQYTDAFYATMGVDGAKGCSSAGNCSLSDLATMEVFRWQRNGLICHSMMVANETVATCSGPKESVTDKRAFFACPEANQKTGRWSTGKIVGVVFGSVIGVALLVIGIYCLACWLISKHKDELDSDTLFAGGSEIK